MIAAARLGRLAQLFFQVMLQARSHLIDVNLAFVPDFIRAIPDCIVAELLDGLGGLKNDWNACRLRVSSGHDPAAL